jgi:hypothetical protein
MVTAEGVERLSSKVQETQYFRSLKKNGCSQPRPRMLMTAVEVDLISTCSILIFPDWVRINVRAYNV